MTNGNGSSPEVAPPQLNVLAQYTKDLSFENPNAPASLAPQPQQPNINIQINVSANKLAESEFEVTLSIEGKADNTAGVMFSFELVYAGVFRLTNVPEDALAVQEETFGPTLTVTKVKDVDEAIRLTNATSYGLAGAVFSRRKGLEIARQLRSGMTSINSVVAFAGNPPLPCGGSGACG